MELTTAFGLLAALAGPLVIARIGQRAQPGPGRLVGLLVAQASLSALVAMVAALAVLVEGQSWRSLGLADVGLTSVAFGLALATFFVCVYGPVTNWALSRFSLSGFEQGLATLSGLPVWWLVFAVLIGGVAEEFLYRAYAFELLAATTGSVWLAGALPLLLFALAHVPMWGWLAALTMLMSGGILTLWYAWHRDLAANVVAHCVTDLVGIVIRPAMQARRAGHGDA